MMPIVTWAPWKPVRTKNVELNRLVSRDRPLRANSVNSKICPPMNTEPSSAVASSQMRSRRRSPRWMAARARTIVRLLMRSTNDDTDVNGMLYTSLGVGPD